MSSSRWMNLICIIAIVLSVVVSVLLPAGFAEKPVSMAYENTLFDPSRVHTIDITMGNWDDFIKTCANEEYAACSVTVDGETFKNVAIRAKGNTSLSSVSRMDSDRYSFKIEFDHYDSAFSYHGLDKLSLNNIIQDNTFMKDYLTLRMMGQFGVPAPLTSFAYITVNGEDWGLYLAVEGVEDAFLLRNYGKTHGELYKPDSMDMGGGRGNGKEFDMADFENHAAQKTNADRGGAFGGFNRGAIAGGFGGRGANDVKLVYTDDEFENYSNIFENAKTDVTDQDKKRLIASIKRMNEGDTSAVNAEDVIRYFVVHNFVVNDDSYTGTMIHNYYLYEENGVLSMIPWDYNLAYGTFQSGNAASSVNRDILSPVTGGMDDRPMIAWIFENDAYTENYKAYFEEFLNSVDALNIIESAQAIIAPYVEKDPTKFCTYEEFETGVSALKTFVELRSQSVFNQLASINETVNTAGYNTSDMGTMGMGGKNDRRNEHFAQMSMPGMPTGEMGAMPQGGFTPPGMSGAEIPNETPVPDTGVQIDPQDKKTEADAKASDNESANEAQSAWRSRINMTGVTAFSNMSAVNTDKQTKASSETLLLISICVLLASIAIACFIKH